MSHAPLQECRLGSFPQPLQSGAVQTVTPDPTDQGRAEGSWGTEVALKCLWVLEDSWAREGVLGVPDRGGAGPLPLVSHRAGEGRRVFLPHARRLLIHSQKGSQRER